MSEPKEPFGRGIHHITVLGGDAQRTVDFYVKILGLRLIMKTVNQDDPSKYHLFFVNGTEQIGSSLTFFPWPMAVQGKPGPGEAVAVSFLVPPRSIGYWAERFGEFDVSFDGPFTRFGLETISFMDPDRLRLELVFDPDADEVPAWSNSTVPESEGIRGFWGTTLHLEQLDPTASLLTSVFGFREEVRSDNQIYLTAGGTIGKAVILEHQEQKPSQNGRGIVHHVAFRARDTEELRHLRKKVMEWGLLPTNVIDRHFFQSVYFRSPGGILFEIATDGPGYSSAQPDGELGKKLFLPPWLGEQREMIEKRLPEIRL
jgi:glyoxalase family protein